MQSNRILFTVLSLLVSLCFVTDLLLGSLWISPSDLWDACVADSGSSGITREILFNYRLPKAITALFVGAALSVSGLLMQTLFRNPLAGPDVLGVNSGAGLGVALVTMAGGLGLSIGWMGNWGILGASFLGAMLVLLTIVATASYLKSQSALLIAGIMLGNIAGAIVSIIQNLSNPDAIKLFIIWTFGSLSSVTWSMLTVLIPVITITLILSFFFQKQLNTLLLGSEYAIGLGVDVKRLRIFVIVFTALLAGTATVFAGPIAFIGVTVPHLARWICRTSNHATLIPASALMGGTILILCDLLSQLVGSLPINAVTSLFGAPVIIYILLRGRKLS